MKSYHDKWRNFLSENRKSEKTIITEAQEVPRYTAEAVMRVANETGVNPAWLWGLMTAESGGGQNKFRGGKCSARAFNNSYLRRHAARYNESTEEIKRAGVKLHGTSFSDSRKDETGDSQFHKCFAVAPRAAISVTAWGAKQVMGFNIKKLWEDDPQGFYDRWFENNGANQCALSEEFSKTYNLYKGWHETFKKHTNLAFFYGPRRLDASWRRIVSTYLGGYSEKYRNNVVAGGKQFIKNRPNLMKQWWRDRGKSEEEIDKFFKRWYIEPANLPDDVMVEPAVQPIEERILIIGDSNATRYGNALQRHYKEDSKVTIRVSRRVGAQTRFVWKQIENPNSSLNGIINTFQPTKIVIGSLGGNDWGIACSGNEAVMEKYIDKHVKPLMEYIKSHGGWWNGLPPAGPDKTVLCGAEKIKTNFQRLRSKINVSYKAAAEQIGLKYNDTMNSGLFNPKKKEYHANKKEYDEFLKRNPPLGERGGRARLKPSGMPQGRVTINDVSEGEISEFKLACEFWNNPEETWWFGESPAERGYRINKNDPYAVGDINFPDGVAGEIWSTVDKIFRDGETNSENIAKQINKLIDSNELESPTIIIWKADDIDELYNSDPTQYPPHWAEWYRVGLCDGDWKERLEQKGKSWKKARGLEVIKIPSAGSQPIGTGGSADRGKMYESKKKCINENIPGSNLHRGGSSMASFEQPWKKKWDEFADDTSMVVKVVLHRNGKCLLLQNADESWDLPGGHINQQDIGSIDALHREVFEETGLSMTTAPGSFAIINGLELSDITEPKKKFYVAPLPGGDAKKSGEHVGLHMCPFEKIADKENLSDEYKEVIHKALEIISRQGPSKPFSTGVGLMGKY
jgi:ADP-ribose pyrophosphatase YjhB (NUDIX family)